MKKDSRRLPLADWQLDDSDRLKEIFQKKRAGLKLTQEKLAEGLGDGVTQGAISHFMNRRTALSMKAVAVFAKMLDVSIREISPTLARQFEELGLSDPSDREAEPARENRGAVNTPFPAGDDTEAAEHKYAHIPQYTAKAAAGMGYENLHVESFATLAFKRDWLKAKGAKPESLMIIYADGESMWPTIDDHDVLLVDTSKTEPVDGQVFVLASNDKGAIVKRLVQSPLGSWIIRSDNEDKTEHGDLVLTRSDVNEHRIIGRVIWRGGDL
ncbi:LexA family transcriptional regulator [Pseudomonas sp. PS01301]|uniref:LexA family transcriptional regulator n=1 Tax=Pseudomonas sp. PS01301 TaxID=2991437 RepID=UPI00249B4384|nr:LexA family transcriptional regulator [Pseudomonas sp. PS01301]